MSNSFPPEASWRTLEAGEIVWAAGDPAGQVILLHEGALEVVQHSLQGEDAVLNRLLPGEIAGEMSCLDGQPHSATLRAAGPAVVRWVQGPAFLHWLSQEPPRMAELWHRLSARLRVLSSRLADVSFDPVQLRLARFLLSHPQNELRLTQQQVAENVAATRESVSKALNHFARHGWVRLGRGQLLILDRAALAEFVALSRGSAGVG